MVYGVVVCSDHAVEVVYHVLFEIHHDQLLFNYKLPTKTPYKSTNPPNKYLPLHLHLKIPIKKIKKSNLKTTIDPIPPPIILTFPSIFLRQPLILGPEFEELGFGGIDGT